MFADNPIGRPGLAAETRRLGECRTSEIKIAAGELAWGAGERMAPTLRHEFVHAIVLSRINDDSDLPVWMMEGLAVWGSDQLERNADILLGNHLRRPAELPSIESWVPPTDARLGQVDYFMAGVLVSVALPDVAAIREFLRQVASGTEWTSAMEGVSGQSMPENLDEARRSGVQILRQVRAATRFEELADAMTAQDTIALERLASQVDEVPGMAWALADLQKFTCIYGDLARCQEMTTQLRNNAKQLSVPALVRTESNLARALLHANRTDECTRIVWDALRRGSTRLNTGELSSAVELVAECTSQAGDADRFLHAATVAADVLADSPDYVDLYHRLEKMAIDMGIGKEFHTTIGDAPAHGAPVAR